MAERSRRQFIEATLASGGIALVAGCSSGGDGEGGNQVDPIIGLHWAKYPVPKTIWQNLSQDLEELGFEVQIESRQIGQGFDAASNKDEWFNAPLITWGSTPSRMDPHWYVFNLHHSSEAGDGGFNMSGMENDEIDSLLDQQAQTFDDGEREQLLKDVQQEIMDQHVDYVLTFRPLVHAYNKNKFGNINKFPGVGIGKSGAFWTHVQAEPKTNNRTLVVGARSGLDNRNQLSTVGSIGDGYFLLMYDTLLKVNTDLELIPWLASDYNVDGNTITMTIREGHQWHDGEPVTAEDVAFTYRMAQEHELPGFGRGIELMENISTNGNTVEFSLSETWAPIMRRTFTYGPIVPQHIWGDVDPTQFDNSETIGSGPFILTNHDRGSSITFDANKDHFNSPSIDQLVFQIFGGISGMAQALENKEIDMAGRNLGVSQASELEGVSHLEIVTTDSFGSFTIHPHVFQPPFDDVAVREAVHHALNRELFVELQQGTARKGQGTVLHPDMFGSAHGDLDHPEYDLEKARSILEEAGYTWNDQGKLMYPSE